MAEDSRRPPAVYRYRLTYVDALAYERLPGEWTGWQKAGLILPLMALGALAGMLEDEFGIGWCVSLAILVPIWAIIGLAVFNWRIHRRARARAAREGQTEVEVWGDHLMAQSRAGALRLGDDMIGKVIVSVGHVFILHRGGAVIVPLRAFDGPEAMRAFGETIDRRSMEAVP